MNRYHTCEYELIDVDMAGCLLCGKVHICSEQECVLVPTEDAEVCTITGLCVRDRLYAETEYTDTVASYNMGPSTSERASGVDRSLVLAHAEQLLLSENSRRAYHMEMTRFRSKMQSMIQQEISARAPGHVNLVHVIEHVMGSLHTSRIFNPVCGDDTRRCVIEECTDFICFLINTCTFFLHMTSRASETRVLVYGLLYLMRCGVVADGICVIPRVAILKSLLPAENTLQTMCQFRPKYITDVENRFKFLFRSMSAAEIRMLAIHSRKVVSRVMSYQGGAEHADGQD